MLAGFLNHESGGVQMKKVIALLLIPMMASVEPGPATQYLMNEAATLLDVGMMRLEILTTEFENRVGLHWSEDEKMEFFKAEVNARYEAEDDKIYVSFLVMSSKPSEAQMEEGCRNAMMQMNIWLLKSLPGLFLHADYDYDDPPVAEAFYPNLKEMFELRCYFSSGRDTSEGRFWAHRSLGALGDNEMTIGKWKMRN
jgi:hypothetical protein